MAKEDKSKLLKICIISVAIIIIFVLRFNTQTRNVLSKFLSPFWDAPVVKEDPEQLQKIIDMQQKKLVDSARGSHSMGSLRAENKVLRELLEAPVPYGYNAVFAHVISHDPASGNRRLVIDKGKKDGLKVGQAVLNGRYLLGRIHLVSDTNATIITISDPNCHVPVEIKDFKNSNGILQGEGEEKWISEPFCMVKHLARDLQYKEGSLVITSTYSKQIPSGIEVGVIAKHSGEMIINVNQLYKNAWVKPNAFETKQSILMIYVMTDMKAKASQ